MRTIQHLIVAAALVLSAGTALAGTDGNVTNAADQFHALSQVSSTDAQVINFLNDEQLENVVGGYTPNPDAPIRVTKWPFPWPGPVCLSCPGPYMDNFRDMIINPSVMSLRVMGY